ncbi:MAG: hypothetical protein EXX96DRAFT_487127, partial [Benjaminiella poitrasii]
VVGFNVDTTGFVESSPLYVNIEGYQDSDMTWKPLVPEVSIHADMNNFFELNSNSLYSKIRLNIAPGGGIGRFRIYGDIVPDFSDKSKEYNLSAANLGARIVRWTDQRYANKPNILLDHGIKISIIIDTTGFDHNSPKNVFIQGCYSEDTDPHYDPSATWISLVVPNSSKRLVSGGLTTFDVNDDNNLVISHIRLYMIPDGGIQQVKVIGTPATKEESKKGPLLIDQGPQVKAIKSTVVEEEGIIIEELEEGELMHEEVAATLTTEELLVGRENDARLLEQYNVAMRQRKGHMAPVKVEQETADINNKNSYKRSSAAANEVTTQDYEDELAHFKRQRRNFLNNEWL